MATQIFLILQASPPHCTGTQPPELNHPGHAFALAIVPLANQCSSHAGGQDFIFLLNVVSRGLSPHSLHTHAAQDRSSPRPRGRGKQQEPLEVGGKGILLGVFSRFFVSASARGRWSQPAGACGPSIHLDVFSVARSPGQSPVSRLPPLRLRLWGRVPRSSRRADRRRRREEPELRSPQLRRWRLSRPGRPHGLRGTCLCPWAPIPLGSGAFLDIWRKRVTKPRPGQLPFRSPREWAGAGPEGRGTFWKVGTGRRFSAERARSNLGEGQRARRKRQASEQSPVSAEETEAASSSSTLV